MPRRMIEVDDGYAVMPKPPRPAALRPRPPAQPAPTPPPVAPQNPPADDTPWNPSSQEVREQKIPAPMPIPRSALPPEFVDDTPHIPRTGRSAIGREQSVQPEASKWITAQLQAAAMYNPLAAAVLQAVRNEMPMFAAVLNAAASTQDALDKLFATAGHDEDMDAEVVAILDKSTPNSRKTGYFGSSVSVAEPHMLLSLENQRQTPSDWLDYDQIVDLLPALQSLANTWNPDDSGISDDAFVAIMIANLHQEGRLQRRNPAILTQDFVRALRGPLDALGDELAYWLLVDSSLGIANIRPTVAHQIFSGVIPTSGELKERTGLTQDYIFDQEILDNFATGTPEISGGWQAARSEPALTNFGISPPVVAYLSRDDVSLTLLAANMYRGIRRAEIAGVTPTVFSISTFLQGGVSFQQEFGSNPKAVAHGNAIIDQMEEISANAWVFGLNLALGEDFEYASGSEWGWVDNQ